MTWLAERYLKWRGWRFLGDLPDLDKMIIIGAPHTSNWDFVVYLAAIRHWRMSPRFAGKHTLFRWPFGFFFRRFGGIPIDRSRPGGMVGQVTEQFEREKEMILVVAPEGTRKAAPHWKSGFARIAAKAEVPIIPARLHFPNKELVMGRPIEFDGDSGRLMDRLRTFYEPSQGKDGVGMGPVRLEEEPSV